MGKMKFNIEKLKSFFFLSIVTLSLSVSAIRVQAAEQMQEPEVEQILSGQDDSVVTGVEISATTMMYAVKKVNVRKEPNTSSGILGELEPGDNIFAVELTDEGWYRVVYAGETGYIRGDFLAVFGDVDEWAASEPEPIEEPDITETTEDDKDAQEADNGEEIEGAESKEEESDNASEQEEQPAGKINIFTILIIVILIIVIFVYAAIQIINEYKNPDKAEEDDDEDESDEDGEWEDDEDESDEDNEWEDDESDNNEMWENDNESYDDKESENNDSEDDMDLDITDLDDE